MSPTISKYCSPALLLPMSRMRKTGALIVGILLAATVSACNTAPPPAPTGKQLTATELEQIYMAGTPVVSQGTSVESGRQWKISRDGKGAQTLEMLTSDFTDTGTYRLDGAVICSKWIKVRGGAESCNSVYDAGDGKYQSANDKGEKTSDFTVSKSL
jgi:hypothetical protein